MCIECVLYYCHRVATQLQLRNVSNRIINTVLLLFWTLSAVLRFIKRYFGNWSLNDEHKTFADPAARAGRARESGGPRFGVFCTGGLSSDRKQYSESRL
jgi:hypothetical protein